MENMEVSDADRSLIQRAASHTNSFRDDEGNICYGLDTVSSTTLKNLYHKI